MTIQMPAAGPGAFKLTLATLAACATLAAPALADRTQNPPSQLTAQETSAYEFSRKAFAATDKLLGETIAKRAAACLAIRTQTPAAQKAAEGLAPADADNFVRAVMQHCISDVVFGSCSPENPYNKSANPYPEIGPDPLPRPKSSSALASWLAEQIGNCK